MPPARREKTGRLKQFERRQEREAAQSGPAIYRHAVRCAMPHCGARTALGFEGKDAVPVGVFHDDGWMAVPDMERGIVAFVCRDCYQEETAQQASEGTSKSEASG